MERNKRKDQYLVFGKFLLALTIFSFWEEDWTLDYNSTDLWESYVVWQLVSQLVITIFLSKNCIPFHLLWKKHLERYLQVPKYYEYGCKFQKWHSFVLIECWLLEHRKEFGKIIAKSKKKTDNRQRQIFQISNLSVPKCF